MMKTVRRILFVFFLLELFCVLPFFSQSIGAQQAEHALVQGFEAYRNEDWHSAMLFFRNAVSEPTVSTDEVWYMLIMSEMYGGEYAAAQADCVRFGERFTFSQYAPYVQYQKGRCLHFLHQNEDAVLVLSDFCHQNPKNDLYASALYWIAESFFEEYNYESSRGLYERIVSEFPQDGKVAAAQYRIDAIDQRGREEKLLYLLKVTGEENLASREDYDRQLRQYETEDRLGLRKQLSQAESRITVLERELAAAKAENAMLTSSPLSGERTASVETNGEGVVPAEPGFASVSGEPQTGAEEDADVIALKRKARQLQYLLEEQKNTEVAE